MTTETVKYSAINQLELKLFKHILTGVTVPVASECSYDINLEGRLRPKINHCVNPYCKTTIS